MLFSPTGSSPRRVVRLRAHGERTGGESISAGQGFGHKNSTLAVLFFARTVRLGPCPCAARPLPLLPGPENTPEDERNPSALSACHLSGFSTVSYFTPQALGFSCCIGNMQRYAILQIISLRPPDIRIFFRQNRSGLFPGLHLQLLQG
mgnify:CR=1 FL=1